MMNLILGLFFPENQKPYTHLHTQYIPFLVSITHPIAELKRY